MEAQLFSRGSGIAGRWDAGAGVGAGPTSSVVGPWSGIPTRGILLNDALHHETATDSEGAVGPMRGSIGGDVFTLDLCASSLRTSLMLDPGIVSFPILRWWVRESAGR